MLFVSINVVFYLKNKVWYVVYLNLAIVLITHTQVSFRLIINYILILIKD